MSSPPQDDADAGHVSSDRDDAPPAESEGSEAGPAEQLAPELAPELAGSTTVTPTPGEHLPVKCVLCEEEFNADGDNGVLPAEALREHMLSAHPATAQYPVLEQEQNDETPAPPLDAEETERLQQAETVAEMSVERRLQHFWNIHDVRNFAPDYDGNDSGLAELWAREFDELKRPAPYENRSVAPREFLPLTAPATFVDLLKNPSSRSTDELYAITMNTAHALRVWQDEYIAIDKLRTKATDTDVNRKKIGARTLADPLDFENKRQAELYGYTYSNAAVPNQSLHEDPLVYDHHSPFFRTGRIPTSPRSKTLQDEAQKKETKNYDKWQPIAKDDKEYLPRRRLARDEIEYMKKREEMKAAVKKKTRAKKTAANNGGAERVTRFSGTKRPTTKEDTGSGTPASTSAPARGGTPKARGKQASRGSKNATPRAASTAASSPAPTDAKSTRSRTAQPAAQTSASTPEPKPEPIMGPPPTRKRRQAATTAPTPVSSASSPGLTPAPTPAPPVTDSPLAGPSLKSSPLKRSTLASSALAGPSLDNSSRAGPTQLASLQTDGPAVDSLLIGPPAPVPYAAAPSRFASSRAASSRASPSRASPSRAAPSTAAPSTAASPAVASPAAASAEAAPSMAAPPEAVPPEAASPTAAPSTAAASAATASGAATTSSATYPDPLEIPKNQEKIRQAKHPKRTEAMIKHWARFIAEGRVRNPKRTKAQIEADKAAEQEAAENAATNTRKRKQSKGEPGTSVFSIKKPKLEENKTAGPQGGDGSSNGPQGEDEPDQPEDQPPTS